MEAEGLTTSPIRRETLKLECRFPDSNFVFHNHEVPASRGKNVT